MFFLWFILKENMQNAMFWYLTENQILALSLANIWVIKYKAISLQLTNYLFTALLSCF